MNETPYRAKTLAGAEREVRKLRRRVAEVKAKNQSLYGAIKRMQNEAYLSAQLAATGPAFFNPLVACEAEKILDRILADMGMAPDGTQLK